YRNNQLIDVILKTCQPTTLLSIAANITLSTEYITTKTVAEWKSSPLPNFHKQPAIFILQKK
ncbi:MAG TPA: SAM-dependent methyltransferase, partial [Bacteroidales bacterium]|nr:SAM-dependent methyltransferase [Bacteroidales bacterium]